MLRRRGSCFRVTLVQFFVAVFPSEISRYTLVQQGASFFDSWNFTVGGDLTHGLVTYVDQNTAVGALSARSNDAELTRTTRNPLILPR